MRIRKEQMAAVALESRRTSLAEALQKRGFDTRLDTATTDLIVADAEQRQARVQLGIDGSMTVTSAESRTVSILPDEQGEPRRITGPADLDTFIDSNEDNRTTTIRSTAGGSYQLQNDLAGQLQEIRYPDDTSFRIQRDEQGWQEIDRNGGVTRFAFGRRGRLTEITDPRSNTTRFDYDQHGWANRITAPDGTAYEYDVDEDGFPRNWKVNGQLHANYRWDDKKPLMTAEYQDGHKVGFLFEGEQLVQARNLQSVLKLKYDDQGNLLEENQNGKIVRYQYDKTNLLTAIITPDNEVLRFERDGEGRICRLIDWSGQATTLQYHPQGPVARISFPNGVVTKLDCNRAGQDSAIRTVPPNTPRPLVDLGYDHDACGRVVAMRDGRQTREYTYDAEGRLTGVQSEQPGLNESFELDAMGNSVRSGNREREVNSLNQVTRYGEEELTYDALGNMTSGPTARGRTQFVYNGQGQLISAGLPANEEVAYEYDPLGRRIRKTVGEVVTEYVWAGFTLLYEETMGPAPFERRDHLFLPGSFLPVAMRVDGKLYYQHTDHRMAPLCLTDEAGNPVWRAEYSAFGRTRILQAEVANPWRLMNQYYDDETGLHYNLARYYHPVLGTYLSADPLLDDGGSLNYYLYALGDPINKADPTGQFILMAIVVGAVAGAVIAGAIEAYRQSKKPGSLWDKTKAVAKKATIGAVAGAVGGAVGGLAAAGAALALTGSTAAVTAGSATIGTLMAVGATEGGAGALAETCVEAAAEGRAPTGKELFWSGLIGTGVGALTAGIGGLWAARSARKAMRETAEEGAEKLAKEGMGEAAEEGLEKAGREGLEEGAETGARAMSDEAADAAVAQSKAAHQAAQDIAPNGISPKHQRKFSKMAQDNDQFIIVRDGNVDSMKFQGKKGYTPKPVTCKAKTAKFGPDAGTVVDPTHPRQAAFWDAAERAAADEGPDALKKVRADRAKAADSWESFKTSQVDTPGSGYTVDPDGVVRLHGDKVHGDYDLHGVFDGTSKDRVSFGSGAEGDPNVALASQRRQQMNETLNPGSNKEMVQHGGQDDWLNPNKRPDPPSTAFTPDGQQVHLADEQAMEQFYKDNGLPWDY